MYSQKEPIPKICHLQILNAAVTSNIINEAQLEWSLINISPVCRKYLIIYGNEYTITDTT